MLVAGDCALSNIKYQNVLTSNLCLGLESVPKTSETQNYPGYFLIKFSWLLTVNDSKCTKLASCMCLNHKCNCKCCNTLDASDKISTDLGRSIQILPDLHISCKSTDLVRSYQKHPVYLEDNNLLKQFNNNFSSNTFQSIM